jgi:hypothetical protein
MAALQFELAVPSIALTAATAKTVAQIKAPANQRVKILGFGFYFDGTTNTAVPVQLRILRQSTAGTMSGATPVADEPELTETIQSTCQTNATAEPTLSSTLRVISIPAYNGMYECPAAFGQEIIIGGGGYLGFEMNAPAGVNVRGWIRAEE